MQRNVFKKSYSQRKQAAASAAVKRARATIISSRRLLAPPRTGGFFGLYTQRGREELKTIDSGTITQSPVAVAGNLVLLNGVATGTDYTNRIGRKIIMKSILMRFWLLPVGTTESLGDYVRVMLVYDKQSNSAAPTVADILNTATYLEPNNLNNRDRFVILKDKSVTFNPANWAAGAVTTGDPQTKQLKFYKRCHTETIFSGTGATVGSIQSGSLYLLMISSTAESVIAWNSRVRFFDA